jgi:TonB family protein
VIETLELEEEESVEHYDAPKLLVDWSSPWDEFVTSVRPALVRSERRLAGEAPFGLIPLRIMIPSYVVEALLILAAIFVQVKIAELQPFVAPTLSSHDVIYYSGDELPRTEDLGGSGAGTAGHAGGGEARHRTQTIRIARGASLVPKVVDAPNLKLPSSRDAVANLLAIKPNPGPPPSEGLHANRTAPTLATALVAPAPNVIRDYTRNGLQLGSVIAPAPSVSRDRTQVAANFSATLIPPAPNVSRDHALVAPALAPAVIPPAPPVSRERALVAPSLSTSVVAPAPNVSSDRARSAPALVATVIPAAPGALSRDLSHTPVQMNATVVPPPVSAPERATARNPKLNLPAPSVVAPPPSVELSQDLRRASGSTPDSSKAVVPPPPTQTGTPSFMSGLIGKIFGATEVVPPPPSLQSNSLGSATGTSLTANIVPPPPTAGVSSTTGSPRSKGAALVSNAIAPPPSTGQSRETDARSRSSSSAPALGAAIVAPPPTLTGTSRSSGGAEPRSGTQLANHVVAPPPSISSSGSGPANAGRGGMGLGAPLDASSGFAPPATGSNAAGAVVSSQPGSKVALPSNGGTGSLAMSPSGGDKAGLGGAGIGSSIGHGTGPGSGMNGAGSGAGKVATGHGSDSNATGGISPAAGPGGAGNVPAGVPPVRGVDISGGNGIVTIPGFGSDSSAANSQTPGRSAIKQQQTFGVTVVATASSGGAFEPYKNLLRGEKYTTYFDTSLGTVVMEFADESAAGHPFGGTLTAPVPMRTNLAGGSPQARLVIACTIDASGNVKNARVLEAGPAVMTAKVVAALRDWKFQPALRGNQPIEVTAIFGFGIDTNDRF